MSTLPPVPLFIGGVEILLIGAVILVLVFGSKATDIARNAGSAAGKVRKTRQSAEKEINEVKGEFEEGIEPVKEDVEAVEEDIKAVEEDIEAGPSDRRAENAPGEENARPDDE